MSNSEIQVTPTRPYMTRAIYEWICDNQLVPYLMVDATWPNTIVPEQFIQDGKIVLNIAPHAVHGFAIENELIRFSARFGGVSRDLFIPMGSILGIYARENGQGLFFDPDEYAKVDVQQDTAEPTQTTAPEEKKKPSLRLLD